ncbi:MAG TPA: hypothetical protein VHG89_09775 [Verrucomicrobiae bacterium]|nr:hypothetical protein [Verrucomicrobiae bacterium]
MKIARLIFAIWICGLCGKVFADEGWQAALSQMPLATNVMELNRTNSVPLLFNAFQSNGVVKALIFMPGATDEIYFFRRVQATVTNPNPSLLDGVAALTNQTHIQATFCAPFLLLHTTEDSLDGFATIKNESTAKKLRGKIIVGKIVFNDADWDNVRAVLNKKLSVGLRPFSGAPESWHFYRHSFAAENLNEWEMLEAIALADKTTFTLHWLTADFRADARQGNVPDLKNLRLPQPSN